MPKIVVSASPKKAINDWSNKDFLLYFSNLLKIARGKGLEIPPDAWPGFLGRMKGFRKKVILTNVQYKEFIDLLFSSALTQMGFFPNFGAIVSERVYYLTEKLRKKTMSALYDFEKLRSQLYSNKEFFKRLEEKVHG